jgi:hypothetical protein
MKRWEAILIFGRDKDDWEKEEFNAPDYDTAMSIAMELAGRSYNVHKLKEIPNPKHNGRPLWNARRIRQPL